MTTTLQDILFRANVPELFESLVEEQMDDVNGPAFNSITNFMTFVATPLKIKMGVAAKIWKQLENYHAGTSNEHAISVIDDSDDDEIEEIKDRKVEPTNVSSKQNLRSSSSSSSSSSSATSSTSTSSTTSKKRSKPSSSTVPMPLSSGWSSIASIKNNHYPVFNFPIFAPESLLRARQYVAAHNEGTFTIYSDGGARNNPGISGAGVALFLPDGRSLAHMVVYLGDYQTNNYAEYVGIILGLTLAATFQIKHLKGHADSKLCVKQIANEWKCKKNTLQPLMRTARELKKLFQSCTIVHVRRELNTKADELSNEAMDGQGRNDYVRVARYDDLLACDSDSDGSAGVGGGVGNGDGDGGSRKRTKTTNFVI